MVTENEYKGMPFENASTCTSQARQSLQDRPNVHRTIPDPLRQSLLESPGKIRTFLTFVPKIACSSPNQEGGLMGSAQEEGATILGSVVCKDKSKV
jgi:hypothetical protein